MHAPGGLCDGAVGGYGREGAEPVESEHMRNATEY